MMVVTGRRVVRTLEVVVVVVVAIVWLRRMALRAPAVVNVRSTAAMHGVGEALEKGERECLELLREDIENSRHEPLVSHRAHGRPTRRPDCTDLPSHSCRFLPCGSCSARSTYLQSVALVPSSWLPFDDLSTETRHYQGSVQGNVPLMTTTYHCDAEKYHEEKRSQPNDDSGYCPLR